MRYCIKCGMKLKDKDSFCEKCGASTSTSIEGPKKSNTWILIAVIAALVFVLLIVIGTVYFVKSHWNDIVKEGVASTDDVYDSGGEGTDVEGEGTDVEGEKSDVEGEGTDAEEEELDAEAQGADEKGNGSDAGAENTFKYERADEAVGGDKNFSGFSDEMVLDIARALRVPEKDESVLYNYGDPFFNEGTATYLVTIQFYNDCGYAEASVDAESGEIIRNIMTWESSSMEDGSSYCEEGDGSLFGVEVSAPDGYVNLRTGPGTDYSIITPITNGEILAVYEEFGKWYHVRFDTTEGWVAASQVKRQDAYSASEKTDNAYSEAEIIEMARKYYFANGGKSKEIHVDIEDYENNPCTIHIYEVVTDHTATFGWYDFDKYTGAASDIIKEEPVDFLKYR